MKDETAGPVETTPSGRARLAFAVAVTIATAAYVYLRGRADPTRISDFDQVWFAAQALWQHEDPYPLIGIGRAFEWKWPFYYPLPAVVLVGPLGLGPVLVARCVFAGLSAGALAWAITRDGWSRTPVFVSVSFIVSVQLVQWSPLLTAALLLPSLSWVSIAKPNWGVAIVASASTPRIWGPLLIGASLLSVVAFVVQPGWVAAWLPIVRSASHFGTPVVLPFGFLMLTVLLRWRRPEARLLLAVACLPQTPGFYDALMLFTIPRTLRESLLLTVCSYVVFFAMAFSGPWPADSAWMGDIARFTLWFLYLPCVVMVLRRPNEGTLPISERLWPRR